VGRNRRTVPAMLDRTAAEYAESDGAVFPQEHVTYAGLEAGCVEAARRLVGLGIRPGDPVGILIPGSIEHLNILLGAMRIGAVPVPISNRFKTTELEYVVRHSQMVALLVDPSCLELVQETGIDSCDLVVIGDDERWATGHEPVSAEQVRELADAVEPEDAAIILYTSGTTSNPKGAVHTHASLVAEGHNLAGRLELGPGDRFWSPLPMFHSGGIVTMVGAFASGATFCHVGIFEPTVALDQLERERCTHAFPAFETIWLAVLDHPRFRDADLSALRVVINVGVRERMKMMQDRLPTASQISCFGSTESCGFMCLGRPGDPLEARLTTSGTILPHMELRVVDPETGHDVAPGVTGEAWFRGESRFSHYHRDPEYTAGVIDADGWFHTGDLISRDADGRVSFIGRLKDMLKVGGENVSPAEIENFLAAHSAVKIVQVVGAPDARYTEVPVAFVELQPGAQVTEAELIEYCVGRIATFKVPRYVRFVEAWPMSGTKVRKFQLREQIAEELRARGITEAPRFQTRIPS
jgi:fatty-acyl-CoA synthase